MKKNIKITIILITLYISLFFLHPLLASLISHQSILLTSFNSLFFAPFSIIGNLFITLFLFLAGLSFLSFIELNKAKRAYRETRNRINFIKDGKIVCLEGTIEPGEGGTPLVSPISQQDVVMYCYGNKHIGGGSAQIKTVIKPSGEIIPLNGWLSGDYVEKKEYDPSSTNLDHLFTFMMEKKDERITTKDVASAPYFYSTKAPTDIRNSFSNHEVIGNLSEEMFNNNSYTEIVIPTGIYGWVLGKWDDKNHQLLPLKFSSLIFVIQKDFKESFLQYILKYRMKYLITTISLFILSVLISIPILLTIL